MVNEIEELLCELGICNKETIAPFYPRVRDSEDILVLKCQKSGVIFLSRSDHINISHYERSEGFSYWCSQNRKQAALKGFEDDHRRFAEFKSTICNKIWLDVGTGSGGILDLMSRYALDTICVEPQKQARECLMESGYEVYTSVDEIPRTDIEIVTMFHVLEHLVDPIAALKNIRDKMKGDAKIIIEVPHANDFLISFLNIEAFKAFTFWSEHLILHTRQSLKAFLEAAGFHNVHIKGYQRYPLANHLYWLKEGKPGGHIYWNQLRTPELESAYANMVAALDKTDTLIANADA